MGKLRERMLEDMQLRGLALKTRKAYLDGVVGLVKFYHIAPEQITEEQIRRYFFYLRDEKQVAEGTFSIHFYGIKFLFETTLGRQWPAFGVIRPKRSKKLPVVLSVSEVHDVLGRIRQPITRMCLAMIYTCGLRLSEGTRLQVADVDGGRMLLAVRNGKGGKDRYVPLARHTLELLRTYWKTERPGRPWLFPGRTQGVPLSHSGVQRTFKAALRESRIEKNASVHSLRHSYATHLRESGVDLALIQRLLGHRSPKTTAIYAHLTQPVMNTLQATLNDLMSDL